MFRCPTTQLCFDVHRGTPVLDFLGELDIVGTAVNDRPRAVHITESLEIPSERKHLPRVIRLRVIVSAASRALPMVALVALSCGQTDHVSLSTRSANLPRPVAVTVATAAPAKAKGAPPCPRRPNIVIVTLDTVRFDATQLDPKSHNQTPVLRRLMARGVNFVNFYSTHDNTPYSHFSLFTGYVSGYQTAIDRPEASLAYQLRRIGYHPIGIVGNGNLSHASTIWTFPFPLFESLSDEWDAFSPEEKERHGQDLDERIRRYYGEPNDFYRAMLYASADQITQRLDRRLHKTRQPFLAFVNLIDSHDPYLPDSHFYNLARERKLDANPVVPLRFRKLSSELEHPEAIADAGRRAYVEKKIAQATRPWSTSLDLDKGELAVYRARYQAEVRELDAHIGTIVKMLERKGVLDSTILIITADHGESLGEDELLTHSFNEQGDIEATYHIPLLIVFPPCYGLQGMTVTSHATLADITPTLYDLIGIKAMPLWRLTLPGNVGHSLAPLLTTSKRVSSERAAKVEPHNPISAAQRTQIDQEALKRFKSLGYLQ